MSTPTVFVFGATGTTGGVGGAVFRELVPDHQARRLKLVAGIRRPEAAAALESQGIETRLIDMDWAEMEGLDRIVDALRGVDRIFLMTGYDVKMLAQSKAVIDAAKVVGVSHIVHLGANGGADTTDAHLGWHQFVEAYIERSGIGFTHLRPSQFMQTLPMLYAIAGGKPGLIENYIGDAQIGWIDAADIAAVAGVALRYPDEHAGQVYPLSSNLASMPEIAAMLTAATGMPWRYQAKEPEDFYQAVLAGGADATYMRPVRDSFERTRKGTLRELSEVYHNILHLTGREPTSLQTYIERNRAVFATAMQ